MKKIFIRLTVLVALLFFTGTASAGNYVENLGTGLFKGVLGAIVCVVKTPVNMYEGAKEDGIVGFVDGFGKIARTPFKLVEEVGYGIAGKETGLSIEDPGLLNASIEENIVSDTLIHGGVVTVATMGILGPHHNWSKVWKISTGVGVVTGAGTALNHK